MSELHTIFSAPERKTENKNVAATERGFQSENSKALEVQRIVADLAKSKTAWLHDSRGTRDYVQGWAGLL